MIKIFPEAFLFRVLSKIKNRYNSWKKKNFNVVIRRNLNLKGGAIGELSWFGEDGFISGWNAINIGSNVQVGRGCWIRGDGGLYIGDNTVISRNVLIYTINHEYEGERLPFDNNMRNRPVTIGANVWIGMNVSILPGTIIEDGVIIGMGTTVYGKVTKCSIVGSKGWQKIGERNLNKYEELNSQKKYGDADGYPIQ